MRWFFLLLFSSLHGAYVGNPASPALMQTGFFSSSSPLVKCSSGYLADYIANKRYVLSQREAQPHLDGSLKNFGYHTKFAQASLVFVERVELFAMAGGAKEHTQTNTEPSWSDLNEVLFDFQSAYHFAWNLGTRMVFVQWGQTFLSGEFTYFAIPSSPSSYFQFFNRLNLPLDLEKQTFYLHEWQLCGALSSRLLFLTPYVGAAYLRSHLHVREGNGQPALDYYNEKKVGYFYGLTVSLTGRLHVNFERRLRDEFAYGICATAVF